MLTVLVCQCESADLLLCAADVLQVCDEGGLALMQQSLQLLKCTGDFCNRLALSFIELSRDLAHQLDGGCELRKPVNMTM